MALQNISDTIRIETERVESVIEDGDATRVTMYSGAQHTLRTKEGREALYKALGGDNQQQQGQSGSQ